ncbi:hypothetical protein FACS189418_6890 [Clostridia bacterium]|nr:hypothetical protein FACS189418_6890 [Clostridia bacterium]
MSLTDKVNELVKQKFDRYADALLNDLKAEAHVITGALRASIRKEKKNSNKYLIGVDAEILKNDPKNVGKIDYSPFYYFGHNGYTIYPKHAKALHFFTKDGKEVFAKKVVMPPRAGDDFIGRAIRRKRSV